MHAHRRHYSLLIAAAVVILAAGVAAAQHTGHSSPAPKAGSQPAMGSPSHEMHKHMTMGMQDMQKMKLTGDVDVDFATMMTMHHKHGIEMARIEAEKGKDEKIREMARKIIESQEKESQQFKEWLAGKGHPFKD